MLKVVFVYFFNGYVVVFGYVLGVVVIEGVYCKNVVLVEGDVLCVEVGFGGNLGNSYGVIVMFCF